jgi:BASS family bile acid:Na+ symporter
MGLDAALVLSALAGCTILIPLSAPLFVRAFADGAVSLSPVGLGLTLFAMLAGAALIAAIVRRLAGTQAIVRRRSELDGMSVLLLLVFCCALMHDVAARSYADPMQAAGLIALAFGVGIAMMVLTVVVFSPAGWRDAFALGLMTSQRNTGLMLAAAGSVLPDLVWFYFAMAQFPIYFAPYLLDPLARRINSRV